MDFGFTDEQEMLRATAREFVAEVCPARKAKEWDEESALPPELFKGMAELGWFSLPFAEAGGGDGGGLALPGRRTLLLRQRGSGP